MKKSLTKKIQKSEWEQYWSGRWSFTTTSYFIHYYTHIMKKQMGQGFTKVATVSHEGHTTCFFKRTERKRFGDHLVKQVLGDPTFISRFCHDFKKHADQLLALITHLKRKSQITPDDFHVYIQSFYEYNGRHICPRHIIDFIPPHHQKKYLPPLRKVRLSTEKVYDETEKFMQQWAQQMGKQTGYQPKHILCLTHGEIDRFFTSASIPKENILAARYKNSAIIFIGGTWTVLTDTDATAAEKLLLDINGDPTKTKGTVAYAGNASGKVRIVLNPNQVTDFHKGDILVTTMTRPEFLPLMKKAAGIVTDLGGLLCHAAIVARELKKPTIIGTAKATKIFKDGDTIEINGHNGWVKKRSS